jgi:hypothetical protein
VVLLIQVMVVIIGLARGMKTNSLPLRDLPAGVGGA